MREIHGSDEERKCRQVTREFRRAFVIFPSYKTCGFSPSSFSLLLNTIEPWQNQVSTSIAIANCIHITIIKKTSQFSKQKTYFQSRFVQSILFCALVIQFRFCFFFFCFPRIDTLNFPKYKARRRRHPLICRVVVSALCSFPDRAGRGKRKQTTRRRKNQPCYKTAGHAQFPKFFFRGKISLSFVIK